MARYLAVLDEIQIFTVVVVVDDTSRHFSTDNRRNLRDIRLDVV